MITVSKPIHTLDGYDAGLIATLLSQEVSRLEAKSFDGSTLTEDDRQGIAQRIRQARQLAEVFFVADLTEIARFDVVRDV